MQYVNGGNLYDALTSSPAGRFSEHRAARYIRQLSECVARVTVSHYLSMMCFGDIGVVATLALLGYTRVCGALLADRTHSLVCFLTAAHFLDVWCIFVVFTIQLVMMRCS